MARARRRTPRKTGAPRRITNRPEETFRKTAVVPWLTVSVLAPAVWWATANEKGTRSTFEQQLLVSLGLKEGIPDIFVLHAGRLLGIELKRPPARLKSGAMSRAKMNLSDGQIKMHAALRAAGAVVTTANTMEAIELFLRCHGVPLRASVMAR